MLVKIEDIEIRGHEVKASKKDGKKYMVVRFEDNTGRSHEVLDWDMENEPYYKRGTVGDIYAELTMGRTRAGETYARLEVSRFQAAAQA